jgi:hypothetical protein
MATKKQQRRRYQRARAHGRGADSQVEGDAGSKPARSGDRGAARGGPRRPGVPQPPSVKRAVRRAAVLSSLFLLALLYTPLGNKQTPASKLLFAVWMFGMFALVTLMTERWAYRRYLKQQGKP